LAAKSWKGKLRKPVSLPQRTRSSTLAWPRWALPDSDVGVGLVGDEDLKAITVEVAEGELGAGMRDLAAADRPCALRPGAELDLAEFRDIGAVRLDTTPSARAACRQL
jgi:hypothetical protein